MNKFLLPLIFSLCLTGCSLIPKNVEFGQSKVKKFPVPTAKQEELQRETAQRAKEKARETLVAATQENSSTNVINPAAETAELTDALSQSVGAPAKRPTATTSELADELRASLAKLDRKVEAFAQKNDEMAGKKVEGTGIIQIPYFIYLGGFLIVVVVLWHLLHTALSVAGAAYPPAAIPASIAVGGMNVAQDLVAKGLKQVVKGGQAFKTWIDNEIPDEALKEKILSAFVANHQTAQDEDVQTLVKGIK